MSAQPIESPDVTRRLAGVRRAARERALGLPKRPKWTPKVPDLSWQGEAACASVDSPTSRRLIDAEAQADVADLVTELCRPCLVREECLLAGREMHGAGTWGGYVLEDGHLAPDERPKVARILEPRSSAVQRLTDDNLVAKRTPTTTAPAPSTEAEPPRTKGGQRWQPKRRSRARRRGRR
ncbi:WhiB family transcriptional regulator [Janibacter melonis]|uniref:WhiB family transcriptional regulator n=1 Tax=Janibacter melonis TaxID=262209 RepID=UPI00174B0404|nr:WhiB family transcriptional regulator [Janibacter melonis]